jgi:hypothetical protein
MSWGAQSKSQQQQGAAEKIKRENDVHLRQLAKKSTYVPTFFPPFFLVRFWAFLGKGSSKTREICLSTIFLWVFFFNFFSFRFFCCVGSAPLGEGNSKT